MTTSRRSEPLRPEDAAAPPPPAPDAFGVVHGADTHRRTDEDRRAFADAVRALRTGAGSLNLSERTLMVVGGIVAPIGLLCVILGWLGAARTPNVFEQIPYLISGGLLGLGLVFLGAFFYFTHWITELVKEQRAGSAALLEAIGRLQTSIEQSTAAPAIAAAPTHHVDNGHATLVATQRGSMAHREECVVVAGKHDLRSVTVADGLAPCKLCDPYASEVPAGIEN